MKHQYVIMIKGRKDVTGEEKPTMRFAAMDTGSYGSGDPVWGWSDHNCMKFETIQKAEEWFKQYKHFLFGTYYHPSEFVMESLSVRKLKYIQEKMLFV
jgi:hypothetical protein